ncbi:hypothetical protein HRbin28_00003 [bacterium HR28]|nr:hypothetical protein HRbin28_00003 [bacterium HR28]
MTRNRHVRANADTPAIPSDHAGWLRCLRCRNYVRDGDPALRRSKGVSR